MFDILYIDKEKNEYVSLADVCSGQMDVRSHESYWSSCFGEMGDTDLELPELLVHDANHVVALPIRDRIHENISMHPNGVFRREERVFVLTGSVQDGNIVVHAIMRDLLEMRVLHCWIVWLDEVIVDILDY